MNDPLVRSPVRPALRWLTIVSLCILTVAPLVASEAACGRKYRVSHRDATCLKAQWSNDTWGTKFRAQNLCPDLGTTVVRWDLRNTGDLTWRLSGRNPRQRKGVLTTVRWAWCCADLGICYRKNPVTDDACRTAWNKSPAARESCWTSSVRAYGGRCRVRAQCDLGTTRAAGDFALDERIDLDTAATLVLCEKRLRRRRCR